MKTLTDTFKILSLMLGPSRTRSRSVYDLLGRDNNLGSDTRYLNLGYWKDADNYDAACRNLALLLGERAQFNREDKVLDVGCGFGEQDSLWMKMFNPGHITAINITPLHIETAWERQAHPRIDYRVASATELPFPAESFSKVIGLESAFHFNTREAFFREAFRVLKPGGKLILADLFPYKTPANPADWALAWLAGGFWQIPLANSYDEKTYRQKLTQAGFADIAVEDIAEHVWKPFQFYAQQRVQDPEIRKRVHPVIRKSWGTPTDVTNMMAYAIIEAHKPAESEK